MLFCSVVKLIISSMKKTCIIYGSTTGTTESVADMIASKMEIENNCVYNASDLTPDLINQFDALILGSSTCGLSLIHI